jgi:uncharacterized protein YjdB
MNVVLRGHIPSRKKSVSQTAATQTQATPTNATNVTKITYSSSNKKVATVDKAGKVTAVKKGTTKIIAKVGSKKATVTVTVK